MDKNNCLQYFQSLADKLKLFSKTDMENGITAYFVEQFGCSSTDEFASNIGKRVSSAKRAVINVFKDARFPLKIEMLIDFLEYLVGDDDKSEKGVVFTPKYIADFIVKDALSGIDAWDDAYRIIDPSCGCGIFIISAIEYIHNKFGVAIPSLINNNLYGIDILSANATRCKLVLALFCLLNRVKYTAITAQIKTEDSLSQSWNVLFAVDGFDFIIGNPPYVNPHDMNKETSNFLRNHFETTKSGVFNIFYAFVEHSMQFIVPKGFIEFIVPNNFLTIKSAKSLRELLQRGGHICKIIDFADNMVFKPVRAYNCIIKLEKKNVSGKLLYRVINKSDDIARELANIEYGEINLSSLNTSRWVLADIKTHDNLRAIERFPINLKSFIRTGIATLRDGVYMVSNDGNVFFKSIEGKRYEVEAGVVKPIYKIPELKNCSNIGDVQQYIIFPYAKGHSGYVLMAEDDLSAMYPLAYKYLRTMKPILDKRDKGKPNEVAWYAYGRTQGLNKYGRKLMFPTFSNKPRFTYVDDEDALFCNGYAVFENEHFPLFVLERILNSVVMDYYVRNTSYAIEGGYFCYQKKYIERFSLPELNDDEMRLLGSGSDDEVNSMLLEKYQITI